MNVHDRLLSFYNFDDSVIESISRSAHDQDRLSFQELADQYNIADGPMEVLDSDGHRTFQILRIAPKSLRLDTEEARLYHSPIALPVDEGLAVRGLRLFASDPSRQLILTGSPSALGSPYSKLNHSERRKVAEGDLSPTVDPVLRYLAKLGITSIENIGYSYGADKAAEASARSVRYNICTQTGVFIESAAVVRRTLPSLLRDLMATGKLLDEYVNASNSTVLLEARKLADTSFIRYALGFLGLTNIAIARCLTKPGFADRVHNALIQHPDMSAVIAWGTSSEIASEEAMNEVMTSLKRSDAVGGRVTELVIEGMHHAGGEDINLHAAIVLQGLREAEQVRSL